MELVTGITLNTKLAGGALSEKEVLQFGAQYLTSPQAG
jgi:hypothetical protein